MSCLKCYEDPLSKWGLNTRFLQMATPLLSSSSSSSLTLPTHNSTHQLSLTLAIYICFFISITIHYSSSFIFSFLPREIFIYFPCTSKCTLTNFFLFYFVPDFLSSKYYSIFLLVLYKLRYYVILYYFILEEKTRYI